MKLKVNEVANELKETPHVIRNWTRDFKHLIPLEKGENGYNFYPPEAMVVLRAIQKMAREQGYSTRQIENHLSGGELAAAAEQMEAPAAATAEIAELKEMMQQLIERQEQQEKQQREFNRALIDRLDQRDKQTTEYMTERRQERLESKQQDRQEEKKPWWKRFF